jgi:hypothetical protein
MEGWTIFDNEYHMGSGPSVPELPLGIYTVSVDSKKNTLILVKTLDKFPMPEKLYDMDSKLIEHVKTWYEHMQRGSLGVLLSGVKGTGKTITAKQICNILGIPVILIGTAYNVLPSFINNIRQNVLYFVDEYEKVFRDPNESMLLTVMDGALDNGFKRVFLLTINELHVSNNLLQRPGRIRYLKKFGDMSFDALKQVVDERLQHKKLEADVMKFISELEIITIDIVKSIIDEVNIFNISPFDFRSIFNVSMKNRFVELYEIQEDQTKALSDACFQRFIPYEGYSFSSQHGTLIITECMDDDTFVAKDYKGKQRTFQFAKKDYCHRAFKKSKK